MTVLTAKQIKASLKAVANWSQRAQTICRTFKFEGFLNRIFEFNFVVRQNMHLIINSLHEIRHFCFDANPCTIGRRGLRRNRNVWRAATSDLSHYKLEFTIAFVNRITRLAQNLNHYPDIDIRLDQVTLTFTTHDAGGIAEKDFSVARQCDEVFLRFFAFRSIQITSQTTKV